MQDDRQNVHLLQHMKKRDYHLASKKLNNPNDCNINKTRGQFHVSFNTGIFLLVQKRQKIYFGSFFFFFFSTRTSPGLLPVLGPLEVVQTPHTNQALP